MPQAMYEASVGHNTNALIGLGIAPNGSVPADQAAALAGLGAYVSSCYSSPVVTTSGTGTLFSLMPSVPTAIDRAVLSENQTAGQLVRGFTLTFTLQNGTSIIVDCELFDFAALTLALPHPRSNTRHRACASLHSWLFDWT
jgi:hypothetical protein